MGRPAATWPHRHWHGLAFVAAVVGLLTVRALLLAALAPDFGPLAMRLGSTPGASGPRPGAALGWVSARTPRSVADIGFDGADRWDPPASELPDPTMLALITGGKWATDRAGGRGGRGDYWRGVTDAGAADGGREQGTTAADTTIWGTGSAVGAGGDASEAAGAEARDADGNAARPTPSISAHPSIPPDFDWRAYLAYNPDAVGPDGGNSTRAAAETHYTAIGRAAGRPYRRLRLLLRYSVCSGLINQHYAHVAALALAAVLGADAALPPAAARDSFGKYFSMAPDRNEVTWSATGLDSLIDVDALVAAMAARGTTVLPPLAGAGLPDLVRPAAAYPTAPLPPDTDPRLVGRVEGVYLQALDVSTLVDRVRAAAVGVAAGVLRAAPDDRLGRVVVDLPCTLFMLRTSGLLPLVSEIARSIQFAPSVVALADRVASRVAEASGGWPAAPPGGAHPPLAPFNGLHLRIEADARDWAAILGGAEEVWAGYEGAMRAAGFGAGTPVYAASGLLSYGAADQWAAAVARLRAAGLAGEVHHKELYLTAAELGALNSEQKALVDFLVLARARAFVGFGSSTFSYYLREHRALEGVPRNTTVLVDSSAVRTDDLFLEAAAVA